MSESSIAATNRLARYREANYRPHQRVDVAGSLINKFGRSHYPSLELAWTACAIAYPDRYSGELNAELLNQRFADDFAILCIENGADFMLYADVTQREAGNDVSITAGITNRFQIGELWVQLPELPEQFMSEPLTLSVFGSEVLDETYQFLLEEQTPVSHMVTGTFLVLPAEKHLVYVDLFTPKQWVGRISPFIRRVTA